MAVVRYSIETLLALNRPDRATPAEDEHARSVARAVAAAMQSASPPRRRPPAPASATAAPRRRHDGAAPAPASATTAMPSGTGTSALPANERIAAALRESPLARAVAQYRGQPDDPQLRALCDRVSAHLESLRHRGAAPRKPPKKPLLEADRAPPLDVAPDALPPLRAPSAVAAPVGAPASAPHAGGSSSGSTDEGAEGTEAPVTGADDTALFEQLVEQLLRESAPVPVPAAAVESPRGSSSTSHHAAPYRPPVPLQPPSASSSSSSPAHTGPFELDWTVPGSALAPSSPPPAARTGPRSPLRTPLHSTFVLFCFLFHLCLHLLHVWKKKKKQGSAVVAAIRFPQQRAARSRATGNSPAGAVPASAVVIPLCALCCIPFVFPLLFIEIVKKTRCGSCSFFSRFSLFCLLCFFT